MTFNVQFVEKTATMGVDFGEFQVIHSGGSGEIYTGSYNVTSKAFVNQVLNTKNKLLTDNINVSEINYFEAANDSGYTFVIGE